MRRSFYISKKIQFLNVVFKADAQFGFQKRGLSFLPDLSHIKSLRGSSFAPGGKKGEFIVRLFISKCCV